ncbi:hypothetical protein POTOM_030992 [Populus tomentosa]|uniref:Pseudouridine synthase RsuA/RluA-like domain-containing protein n=1 Tax=Populus tomentosa TaxID=118781 RepID=A0A8X8CI54_POPTO|nr:hypothetical protein POTOM_030992 [Populus tomentosa]
MLCNSSSTSPLCSFGSPWPDLNDGLFYNDVVSTSSDSGLTLIHFYSSKYKNSAPLQGWLQRIHNGQITIDGEVVKEPKAILRDGMELVYHRLPWREPDAPYLLQVLYEDDDMIALNKPPGLQVLSGGLFQQRTVLMQLQWRASKGSSSLAIQGSHPVPVHRLGRGTSGILLCAKTKVAKTSLAAYFADGTSLIGDSSNANMEQSKTRKISKIYRALVNGILNQDKIIIKQPIGTMRYPGVAKGLYVASPSGKPALSKVEVLERDSQLNQTLVQVEIESGRPHQIRIHLSFIGHPLLGDPLYDVGGQPMCFDSEHEDESFAEDGYKCISVYVDVDGLVLSSHHLFFLHIDTSLSSDIFERGKGSFTKKRFLEMNLILSDKRKEYEEQRNIYYKSCVILLSNPESHDFDFTSCRGYERPAKPVPGDCGYYLHAHQLVLSHPTKNEDGILMVESCIKPLGLLKRFSRQ